MGTQFGWKRCIIRASLIYTTNGTATLQLNSVARKDDPITNPRIIPRAEHPISRTLISENALKVLHRLKEAQYVSLLVGGCVRDLLLGREPKDFDVVTDARPEEIRKLFHSAHLIGRRFRLAHVRFGREIIEVATFRARPTPENEDADEAFPRAETGRLLSDNIFGTQEEDAVRRDFTVNALYYDIRDRTVVDYVGGVPDLERGLIRMIGDPETRFREDPVRMLRAMRFAARLGFRIDPDTLAPIRKLAPLLADVPPARMFEEVLKLFHGGYAAETFELLRQHGLFKFIFPLTDAVLEGGEPVQAELLIPRALANTDARIGEGKPVTPAFLFSAMLWYPMRQRFAQFVAKGMSVFDAAARAADEVLHAQMRHTSVPKRFSVPMREIWQLQDRLERRNGRNAFRLLEHKRFRAAYDFHLLRSECAEGDPALAEWWTRFQAVEDAERKAMVQQLEPPPAHGKKRRKRRRRRGDSGSAPVLG